MWRSTSHRPRGRVGDLSAEYEETTNTLVGQINELGEVKVQRQWLYYQGYINTHEQSVGGRQHAGEIAAQDITADVIRLESSIDALRVKSTFLAEMLRHGG